MRGHRFSQTDGQLVGSVGQSFVNKNFADRRGRGAGSNSNVTFADGDMKFSAGQGGVETYPGCYGLPTYCGWQQIGARARFAAGAPGEIQVVPTVSPYFEPKAVYLFGIDPDAPGTNLRFAIGAVTVGGAPQLAINNLTPLAADTDLLLSDVYNRSDEPLLVNWSVFSTTALARQLEISILNINAGADLDVYACVWGNAVSSLDCYA